MGVSATVSGVPGWVDAGTLLGAGDWSLVDGRWRAELDRPVAADLQARLRGIGIGGSAIEVSVAPKLKRALVRAARTEDARRRRTTTPGFLRPGCRLDAEGRMSLTAEVLALKLGTQAAGASVIDCCAGAGGNAIGFARAGSDVISIEPDSGRLADARHNAQIYGVERRITLLRGTAGEHLGGLNADLLFADVPWGEHWNRLRTGRADLPVLEEVLAAAHRFDRVWLKLPPSFRVGELPEFAPEAWFGRAPGDARRVKFLILRRPAR